MKYLTKEFSYAREAGQNPYTGFMSFQHFRGEKLYSDIVVRPEANRTETERVECYPVSPDAEELGREQGYYPDSSVVYIRILWKEFEPIRGEYNYKFIDSILDKAKAHSQTLIFRLMGHSTRASDDVPDWLKELIPCPERPDGMRIKDSPSDPLFIDLFLEAVRRFGERYDSDPYLDAVDISLPGSWGEGYKLESFPPDTFDRIIKTYTDVFKQTRLLGQAAKPWMINVPFASMPIGWRGDGFGEPSHMDKTYPVYVEQIKDVWKSAPVSFESYWWIGEWQRQGWPIDRIIERSLQWHISSFNAKSIPAPMEWKDKIDAWVAKMGYHFTIERAICQESAASGDSFALTLNVDNVGVAPIYHAVPLYVRLSNGKAEHILATGVDIRQWMPGKHTANISLPLADIPAGEYTVSIGCYGGTAPMIYFATTAPIDGKFYAVGELKIE